MTKYIDINCDMGESYGRWTLGADDEIMPHITSANVACGFHGGDPHVMRKTVENAVKHGVAIGSHPGLPDLMGFGRRRMDVSPQELKDIHRYQTGALAAFAGAAGTKLQHVKPHGIQYHMFEENLALARATAEQVVELDRSLILMTMAMTKYDAEARKVAGIHDHRQAHRRQGGDRLHPRRQPGRREDRGGRPRGAHQGGVPGEAAPGVAAEGLSWTSLARSRRATARRSPTGSGGPAPRAASPCSCTGSPATRRAGPSSSR